jgi:hypothetical protein
MGIFKTPKTYTPPAADLQPAPPPPNPASPADASAVAAANRQRAGAVGGLASTIMTGPAGLTDTANRAKKQLTGQ